MNITEFPMEIISYIFSFLDTSSLVRTLLVCKQWKTRHYWGLVYTLRFTCQTKREILDILKGCTQLRVLEIWNIKDMNHFKEIADLLPNLKVLNIQRCILNKELIEPLSCGIEDKTYISSFISVEKLTLQNCNWVTDEILLSLGNKCKYLKELSLFGCFRISNVGIASFCSQKYATNLRSLTLTGIWKIHQDSIESLSKHCPYLEELILDGLKNIRHHAYPFIAQFSHLKILSLNANMITDECLTSLGSNLKNLISLSLKKPHGDIITDTGICTLILPKLEYLDIQGCTKITDVSIEHLSLHSPNIKTLDLRSCSSLTDTSIKLISSSFHQLKVLELRDCPRVTDEGVCTTFNLKTLQILNIQRCNVTEALFNEYLINCIDLRILNLGFTSITDESIIKLVSNLVNPIALENIHLGGCRSITSKGVQALLETCTNITTICLPPGNISDDEIKVLREKYGFKWRTHFV